ncbi:hypothetical protein ACE1B6_19650 [Aerosakkonemataceae cyanobacterium BLCC-F154]|uniref:Type II toxin-antitoxin system HicB family antitoxin n=1 Tax=Floridaenema fluviatile BLCC-F154 TaxID=3153640 RepID=A0ABV4YH00_9CYAN
MARSISYQEELIESIKDPLKAAAYIEACLEETDPEVLRLALKDIVEAHQRMNQLSEKAKLLYGKLDRMLSENKGEEIYCFNALLDTLGFQLTVTVKSNNKERVTQKKPMNIESSLNKSEALNQLNYSVIIEEIKAGLYSATVWGLPDCKATGATREEAIKNARELLIARLEKAEIVSLEVELPKPEHPWMKFAGMFKDDPDFDEVSADIEAYRRERDAAYYQQLDAEEKQSELVDADTNLLRGRMKGIVWD